MTIKCIEYLASLQHQGYTLEQASKKALAKYPEETVNYSKSFLIQAQKNND